MFLLGIFLWRNFQFGGEIIFKIWIPTGCIKKNKTLLFSPNFQPKSLGNGRSDLLKNHCAKSPHCGLFAQEISSDSDKWFPSYCGWKLGEKKSVLFFLIHPVELIFFIKNLIV